jgi:hypothetical protein
VLPFLLWKSKNILHILHYTYSECASVALVIQHAKRMRRIILPSVACLSVPCFSTLSPKRHDFREHFTGHKTCVLISCTTYVSNISNSRNHSARYHYLGLK